MSFRVVTSVPQSRWERATQADSALPSLQFHPDKSILAIQLPYHLTMLENAFDRGDSNPLESSLRSIFLSLSYGFRLTLLDTLTTHGILLRLLREPQNDPAISLSLAILCPFFMADKEGQKALELANFPADLLRIPCVGGNPNLVASLFIGFAHEIHCNVEIKKHFIEGFFW
jgi:hypothetical protein